MGESKSAVSVSEVVRPTVGRIVHYVASADLINTEKGTVPDVRTMLITGVHKQADGTELVNGVVFRNGPTDTLFLASPITEVSGCSEDQLRMKPDTWHWPLRS